MPLLIFMEKQTMITTDTIRAFYQDHEPGAIGRYRYFSVLVPFVMAEGELCLMYEVRAKDMERDPGEICFPGGHVEKGEDPLETALRETEEEVGISREHVEIIGQGDTLYGYANYSLFSYIGIVDYEAYKNAVIEESEVDEVFLLPVSHILATEGRHFDENVRAEVAENFPFEEGGIDENYSWRVGTWTIPVYDVDGRPLWGLTARITEHVLAQLQERQAL